MSSKGNGLFVIWSVFEIQRPIDESYDKELKHRIIFQENLPTWNYLVLA